ncbi:hypothetical protein TrST_g14222 [Triparma strigata]|uniref:J domain-containing protein n=1 Tax=Triparma strigata TaxID=1606541 RepID=A0A9W7AVC5_9STRA|nr:hypothetical protein TrST_g14222 [Triparma strigata]
MDVKTAFETLDLPRTATIPQITKRYRQLALSHHPDRRGAASSPSSSQDFVNISNAYEALTKSSSSVPVHDSTTGHDSSSLSTKVEVTGGFIGVVRCLTVHNNELLIVSTDSCTFAFRLSPTAVLLPTVLSPSPSLCSSSTNKTFLITENNTIKEYTAADIQQIKTYDTGDDKITSLQHDDLSIQYTTENTLCSVCRATSAVDEVHASNINLNTTTTAKIIKIEFLKKGYVSVTTSDQQGIIFGFDSDALLPNSEVGGHGSDDEEDWFPDPDLPPPPATAQHVKSTLTLPPSTPTLIQNAPVYDLDANSTTLICVSQSKCHSYSIEADQNNNYVYTLNASLEPDSPPSILYSCKLTQNYIICSGASGRVHVFNNATFTPFKSFSCVEKSTCFLNTDTINCIASCNDNRIFVGGYQGVRIWNDDEMNSTIASAPSHPALNLTLIPFDIVRTHIFKYLTSLETFLLNFAAQVNTSFSASFRADNVPQTLIRATHFNRGGASNPDVPTMAYEDSLTFLQDSFKIRDFVLEAFYFTQRRYLNCTVSVGPDLQFFECVGREIDFAMQLFGSLYLGVDAFFEVMENITERLQDVFDTSNPGPVVDLKITISRVRDSMKSAPSDALYFCGGFLCGLLSREVGLIPYKLKDGKFNGIDLINANWCLTCLLEPEHMLKLYSQEECVSRIEALALSFVEKLRSHDFKEYTFGTHKEFILDAAKATFTEAGFSGNRTSYYDPKNSFLSFVLKTKSGNPISLSVLYCEVVSRGLKKFFSDEKLKLDIVVRGLNFPSHFMVSMFQVETKPPGKGLVLSALYVDAFEGYQTLSPTDIIGISANMRMSSHEVQTILDNSTPKNKITSTGISARNNNIQIFERVLNNLRNSGANNTTHRSRMSEGDRMFHSYKMAILAYVQLENQKQLPYNADDEFDMKKRMYMVRNCFAGLDEFSKKLKVYDVVVKLLKLKGY